MTKWLVAVLMFLSVEALADTPTKSEIKRTCKTVHWYSWKQVKCKYDGLTESWTLKFKSGAYGITISSGQHDDLIRFLCSSGGKSVRELNGRVETLLLCDTYSN